MTKIVISDRRWEISFKDGTYRRFCGYWFLGTQPLYFIQEFCDRRVEEFPPKFQFDSERYWLIYLSKHQNLFCEFLNEYDLISDFRLFCTQWLEENNYQEGDYGYRRI
ncbi:hypothetical protein RyT2_07990 [Pseudolactococcus yaeyamensis]